MNQRWQTRTKAWLKGLPFAWAGLVLWIALSLAVGWNLYHNSLARQRARFEGDIGRLDAGLVRNLEAEMDLLRGAQGFFEASPVDGAAWNTFVRRFQAQGRYPGIRSLGFLSLVKRGQEKAFSDRMARQMGFPIKVQPVQDSFGVYGCFVTPQLKDPGNNLGANLLAEPARRQAILRAIEGNELSVTQALHLIGLDDPAGGSRAAVVVYLPVYRRGASLATPQARLEAAEGVVFISLLVHQVFEPVLDGYASIRLVVRDETPGAPTGLLYEGLPRGVEASGFHQEVRHQVGQRSWVFAYRDARGDSALLAFRAVLPYPLAGIALALLFFGLSRSLVLGRLRAERLAQDLRQSEDRFRRVADQAPCGILLLSERVEYVNPFFLERLGYRKKEVIGKSLLSFIHPEDRDLIHRQVEILKAAEPVHSRLELRVLCKDGGFRWVDITLGTLGFGKRKVALATAFDITERLQAEARRLEVERGQLETRKLESLRVLAGGIAHDFNNLLGVVLGNADMAEGQAIPDQNLRELREACLRAAGLTRQLLAFSGGEGHVSSPTDLNACIRRALERVAAPRGPLDLSLDAKLPKVLADPALLEQMAIELLENAMEAVQDGPGRISICTQVRNLDSDGLAEFREAEGLEAGPFVSMIVEDQGRGMEPEQVSRVFDPFFTTKFVGRGLGLAALLGAVRSHRGGVRVESRPGRGSRFEVILPVHETPEATQPIPVGTSVVGNGTVLVVDDEPGIRGLAMEILRAADIPVLEASGGRQALAQVAAHRSEISLLVLDMAMPDLTGAEVIRALRGTDPGIAIILSSGYAEEDLRRTLQPGDIVAFLPKPYRLATLVALVKEVLEGKRLPV
jgi:PAS domain S-box-containing protein